MRALQIGAQHNCNVIGAKMGGLLSTIGWSPIQVEPMQNIHMKVVGAPSEQHARAVQECGSIASSLWNSTVETRVLVKWTDLPGGVVASGEPQTWIDVGVGRTSSYYTVASAKTVLHQDLNEVEYGNNRYDVIINVDTKTNWFLPTRGQVPSDKYDLITTCLHELQHGLFLFSDSIIVRDRAKLAIFSKGIQQRYDAFVAVETEGGDCSIRSYATNPVELYRALTSGKLWFRTSRRRIARLYAPRNWIQGSSMYHIDPKMYPGLMRPSVDPGHRYHTVDKKVLQMQHAIRNWSEPGARICGRGNRYDPPLTIQGTSPWAIGAVVILAIVVVLHIIFLGRRRRYNRVDDTEC